MHALEVYHDRPASAGGQALEPQPRPRRAAMRSRQAQEPSRRTRKEAEPYSMNVWGDRPRENRQKCI